MTTIIKQVYEFSKKYPNKYAIISQNEKLTYKELWIRSKNLASHLATYKCSKPIIIYGHKQCLMIISFLACAILGIPYVPVDSSTPINRLSQIIDQSDAKYLLNVCNKQIDGIVNIFNNQLIECCEKPNGVVDLPKVFEDTTLYIMFTSGTNGVPKGISISHNNVLSFLRFISGFASIKNEKIEKVLNQARFSFDLSVGDIYYSLYYGKTLCILENEVQSDFKKLFASLKRYNCEMAVMTPSFAEYCMLDQCFNRTFLCNLKTIFFCGEQLSPITVKKLLNRFKKINIVNAYGPTECTVAVCGVEINKNMLDKNILPISKNQDYNIYVGNNSFEYPVGEIGEIIIHGSSVGNGYIDNKYGGYFLKDNIKHYNTGDLGIVEDGYIYCLGRKDRQIKRNGYRIELDEVEYFAKQIDGITNAAVDYDYLDNKLILWISIKLGDNKGIKTYIKNKLKNMLPNYMLPNKIIIVEQVPINHNGKCDYKRLLEEYKYATTGT